MVEDSDSCPLDSIGDFFLMLRNDFITNRIPYILTQLDEHLIGFSYLKE